LDVAHIYPDKRVVGIDISAKMITYAQAQATAQSLSNVTFSVMNALEPFKFAAGTFDLVNARAAASYVVRAQWPAFLQNCLQLLRPGGILRITEVELVGLTNSLACEKMISWVARMIHANGYGFSPDGSHYGTIPMLGLLLQDAGCVNIGSRPHMLDYSTGTAFHDSQYQNYMVWPVLLKAAFVRQGLTTEEEFEQTYSQMLEEMQMPRFRGLWSMLTVWGEKQA
jgi:SAM-dependent methyltransferase